MTDPCVNLAIALNKIQDTRDTIAIIQDAITSLCGVVVKARIIDLCITRIYLHTYHLCVK